MAGTFREIDLAGWKRATHCQIFRNHLLPQYAVSFELDVTAFRRMTKAAGYSFTLAMIHTVTRCAGEIEEFRYRFLDGRVVLYDTIDTAFAYLNPETELFKFVAAPMQPSLAGYVALARRIAENQKEYFTGPPANDVFIFSPLPWVSFTHVSHTDSGKKEQAAPMFDWGKFFDRGGRTILPFSVQVHHSFVDGIHIGKLADRLQHRLDSASVGD